MRLLKDSTRRNLLVWKDLKTSSRPESRRNKSLWSNVRRRRRWRMKKMRLSGRERSSASRNSESGSLSLRRHWLRDRNLSLSNAILDLSIGIMLTSMILLTRTEITASLTRESKQSWRRRSSPSFLKRSHLLRRRWLVTWQLTCTLQEAIVEEMTSQILPQDTLLEVFRDKHLLQAVLTEVWETGSGSSKPENSSDEFQTLSSELTA